MPRSLGSVNKGGYAAPLHVADQALDALLSMMNITDTHQAQAARDRIVLALENFKTARINTAPVKTIREDSRDLRNLEKATSPDVVTALVRQAIDRLELLRTDNPVLHQRLKRLLREPSLLDRIRSLAEAEETIYGITREINTALSTLAVEIKAEDGRGRPSDPADCALASALYTIWTAFTDRGTAQQNASDRPKRPFGDFVDVAGRLVDPGFNGHHVAREIHKNHRQARSGDK